MGVPLREGRTAEMNASTDPIRDAAKHMAEMAISEGSRIAFDVCVKFCERMAGAYAAQGNQAAMAAAQECANGLKELKAKAISPATNETAS